MQLDRARALPIIKAALKEDIGKGDITTQPLIGKLSKSKAVITSGEDCVICGLGIAEMVMSEIDCNVHFKPNCKD